MAKQHLLLVDSDARNLRVLEVSLRKAGFSVTTAVDGYDALEKCAASSFDLVISDTRLPRLDGFGLCQRLKADPRYRDVPFIFLTAQRSVEDKVRGFELGADDYLTKPIYVKEIVTRVTILAQKREKELLERRDARAFSGSLADMGVVDLVQTFEMSRKTGTIRFTQPTGETARVYFREGKILDAELGRLVGEHAFYRLLNWQEGTFEIDFGPVDRPNRIQTSTQGALMEGMRRIDECGRILESLPPTSTLFVVDSQRLAARLAELPDEINPVLRLFEDGRSIESALRDNESGDDLALLTTVHQLYADGILVPVERRAEEGSWFSSPDDPPAEEPAPIPESEAEPVPEPEVAAVYAPLPGWEPPVPEPVDGGEATAEAEEAAPGPAAPAASAPAAAVPPLPAGGGQPPATSAPAPRSRPTLAPSAAEERAAQPPVLPGTQSGTTPPPRASASSAPSRSAPHLPRTTEAVLRPRGIRTADRTRVEEPPTRESFWSRETGPIPAQPRQKRRRRWFSFLFRRS